MHRTLFIILLLLCCKGAYCEESASTIRCVDGKLANVYFSNPETLTYKDTALISNLHADLLQTVNVLGMKDQYDVNHLFAQLFCITKNRYGRAISHVNISWDATARTVCLTEDLTLPLINFVSRNYKEKTGYEADIPFWYLNASHCSHIALAHSEHLLMHYLEQSGTAIATYLSNRFESGTQIEKLGILLYSSLDSCDACQAALLRFFDASSTSTFCKAVNKAEDPLWAICFFCRCPLQKIFIYLVA